MSISYTVETVPSERVPATSTLPALHTIVLHRVVRPAPPPNPDALPLRPIVSLAGHAAAPEQPPEPFRCMPALPLTRTAQLAAPHQAFHPAPPVVADGDGWRAPDGPTLKALRNQADLSQRQAAALGYVMRSTVSDLETGRRAVGKGLTSATLRGYVEALQQAAANVR